MKENMPSITLNMIVKNEGNVIIPLLQSVKSLIDYWVIVDTGSTDNTKEVIKSFFDECGIPGEIHDRPWVNFGHNRTEGIRLAESKGDYLLCLDADMILVNKGFDKSMLTHDAYAVVQKTPCLQYSNLRLLKTSKRWQSVGVTHEYYDCGEYHTRKNLDVLLINDIGNGGCKSDKFARDIKLLRKGLIDEPKNERYMFYLAQSYKDIGEYKKAIKWYRKRIAAGGWDEERWYAMYQILICKVALKRPFPETLAACIEAYSARQTRIEPIVTFMQYCRENNISKKIAYAIGMMAKDVPFPSDQLFIQTDHYEWRVLDELSILCYYNNDFDLGLNLMSKLIAGNKFPAMHKQRIMKNYEYYMERKAMQKV